MFRKLQRSHVLDLLKTEFSFVGVFQDHKAERSGVIKGLTWSCEANSINPILHFKLLAKVDFNRTCTSVHTFCSVRNVFLIAWLGCISVRQDFILPFFAQCLYSLPICLTLTTSCFLIQLAKVLSIHAKQQLLYGTGIRCNIKH